MEHYWWCAEGDDCECDDDDVTEAEAAAAARGKVRSLTPGAIEWMYLDWADRYVTVPGRD